LLSEYVDGALPAGQVAELEQHLADCEQCRQALDDLRQTLALVQELEEVATPEDLLDRVHAQIEAEAAPARDKADRRPLLYLLNSPQLRVALAASLVAMLGIYALRQSGPAPQTEAPPVTPVESPITVSPAASEAIADVSLDTEEVADEDALLGRVLEERLPEPPAEVALDASASAAKKVAPRSRTFSAEADGEIWGSAKGSRAARSLSEGRALKRDRLSSSSPAPAVSAPAQPARLAEAESTFSSLRHESRADEAQEVVVAERASRAVAAFASAAKEAQAPRVETITVTSTDPAAVMQLVARFTQEEKKKRAGAAGMSREAARELSALAVKGAAPDGTVVYARVAADRYEELVAALKALEQTPADEGTEAVVSVVVTIVQL